MADRPRPLSPHLQVYRLPITGLLSITHRITGVGLCFALIGFVYLLASIALGELSFQTLHQQLSSWIGILIYSVLIFAMLFHLSHGVRHLFWDIGKGFNRQQLTLWSILELLLAVALTLAWLLMSI